MAIYHFSAKVISRATGSSAVAAAAYRAASRLHDDRLDRPHDFTNKAGVIHSEILAPEQSPERWQDRETLWNEVEAERSERTRNSPARWSFQSHAKWIGTPPSIWPDRSWSESS